MTNANNAISPWCFFLILVLFVVFLIYRLNEERKKKEKEEKEINVQEMTDQEKREYAEKKKERNKQAFNTNFRKRILYTIHEFSEWVATIMFLILILLAVLYFSVSIKNYFIKNEDENLLKNLLNSFEFIFLAPVPLFIVSSFRGIFSGNLPSALKKDVTEALARKLFISSLIAILATLVVTVVIKLIAISNEEIESGSLFLKSALQLTLILMISFFTLVLIYFYGGLSKEKKNDTASNQEKQDGTTDKC